MYKIYLATNTLNNKKYVGMTKLALRQRIALHSSNAKKSSRSKSVFADALKKYGIAAFCWETICEHDDFIETQKLEVFYIKKFKTHITNGGYNLTTGGYGIKGLPYEIKKEPKHKKSKRVKMFFASEAGLKIRKKLSEEKNF